MKLLKEFFQNNDGATAIEYGLIAGLISIAIVGSATTMGSELNTLLTDLGDEYSKINAKNAGNLGGT
ncbi:MAG: Flp family type IVb pilin [Pseudomonadota bacterium]